MGSVTAASILDQARIRHPKFNEADMPDGALLLFLNQRQRTHLLDYGEHLGPLVTTSVEIATTINGILVGSSGGVPVYLTTYADGWPVFSSGGVPYFDFTGAKIAGDPFGQNGGTPGFPLPDNFVKLVNIAVTYESGVTGPVSVVDERSRHHHAQGREPAVFINGNRLIPILPTADTADGGLAEWDDVETIALSYIALPTLSTLTATVTLPDVLAECLVADVAALLATRATGLSAGDRQNFRQDAALAAQALAKGGDIVGDVPGGSVLYIP
jgi:hypothetical protein